MENDDLCELFVDIRHDRFLMHLIGHHICAIKYATASVEIGVNDGTSIYPIVGRFFRHSCYPNAVLVTFDRSIIVLTIRPIKKDEEITISYMPDELDQSTKDRRKYLLERYRFFCMCERCNDSATVENGSKSKNQQYKVQNSFDLDPKKTMNRRKVTTQCIAYFNDNGREKWCNKTSKMLHTYMHVLRSKYYLNLQH